MAGLPGLRLSLLLGLEVGLDLSARASLMLQLEWAIGSAGCRKNLVAFAGFVLFCFYCLASWSEAKHTASVLTLGERESPDLQLQERLKAVARGKAGTQR